MNTRAMMFAIARGGPFGSAMAAATLMRDAAYRDCKNLKLRRVADALDDFEGRMWNREGDTGKVVALTATLVAALLLDSPRLTLAQVSHAPEKLIRALDAAAEDEKGYCRHHYKRTLEAYRALYGGEYARCEDRSARAAARGILRMANSDDPSRAIEALKLAIALLDPKVAV
ncbi:hypothetical protein PQR36_33090 [Paraburkholderia nemoris]|uniref:hypothetical protein n=1 Tax=Paraburkholderia nemoris TaxID=2793076 RepID=UPI0038B9E92A